MTETEALSNPYILKSDIEDLYPGTDVDTARRKADIYENNKGRFCDKVDLSFILPVMRNDLKDDIMKVNCLKEESKGDIIFCHEGKPVFFIRKGRNKFKIISQKEGSLIETNSFKHFNTAVMFCLCRMLEYHLF